MTTMQIIVTNGGIGFMIWIAWYFWFSTRVAVKATVAGKRQEVMITVKGGYTPDIIVVKAGLPVRLNFNRQETSACSEMVVFPDFNKSAYLPTDQIVSLDILPEKPGEYEFSCQMGMLKGKLIAE